MHRSIAGGIQPDQQSVLFDPGVSGFCLAFCASQLVLIETIGIIVTHSEKASVVVACKKLKEQLRPFLKHWSQGLNPLHYKREGQCLHIAIPV